MSWVSYLEKQSNHISQDILIVYAYEICPLHNTVVQASLKENIATIMKMDLSMETLLTEAPWISCPASLRFLLNRICLNSIFCTNVKGTETSLSPAVRSQQWNTHYYPFKQATDQMKALLLTQVTSPCFFSTGRREENDSCRTSLNT